MLVYFEDPSICTHLGVYEGHDQFKQGGSCVDDFEEKL